VISVAALAFIAYLVARLQPGQWGMLLALALIAGGAIGNFIDRLQLGWVVDFIDIRMGRARWPTFNVADVAITIGVLIVLIDMMIGALPRRKSRD
jgi:signal peptidase II